MGWVSNVNFNAQGEPEFYTIANQLFNRPVYTIIYIEFFIILGFHLYHAFHAAFQSLGINHPTYTPWLEKFALIYSVLVPLGFIIIPLFIFFIR
jgi:succinate dehydrogenase / fumarate reductase cytochrome b subunit